MFFKIAIHNVKRSLRDYAIYFLTLTFGVCLFYVFNSTDSQQAMTALDNDQREIIQLLTQIIGYVSIFISVILGFLMIYSNRFLMKRRKKELGIYMLLGMNKSKISHILITETLLIGLFSLGVGLTIGILVSQGLSAVTAGMFEMDLSSFQFTFSLSALLKTLLYFGIIFFIVMVFNTVSISKYRLITLLQANRKNETFTVRNTWISAITFIISVGCLVTSYYLVLTKVYENFNLLLLCIILGCAGTLLFFFSLSGIFLRVIKMNKPLYYKGLNMFIFRQIGSKINTTFLSVGLICLMLFVTMVTFSVGMSVSYSSSQAVKLATPYDLSILEYRSYNDDEGIRKFQNNMTAANYHLQEELNNYAQDYFEISYYNDILRLSDIAQLFKEIPEQVWSYSSVNIVSLTDYNRVLASQNQEPITLEHNEFAVICNSMVASYYQLAKGQTITVNNQKFQLGIDTLLNTTLFTEYGLSDTGTIILPDGALKDLSPDKRILNITYKQNDKTYASTATNAFEQKISGDQENSVYFIDKQDVYTSNTGVRVIFSFISIYIGLVFLITCVAILALQQLSEASDNTYRYNLLRKLGADSKMINRALFTQIAIYFCIPLILAVVHTVVGIKFSESIVVWVASNGSFLSVTLIMAGILLLIYGGYFLATYVCCKGMIRPKKS